MIKSKLIHGVQRNAAKRKKAIKVAEALRAYNFCILIIGGIDELFNLLSIGDFTAATTIIVISQKLV